MSRDTARREATTLSRRRLLGLVGSATFLAGCSTDGTGAGTPTGTPTDSPVATPTPDRSGDQSSPTTGTTPTASPTPSDPPDLSFVGYAVQRSAFYARHPDFDVVWAPPDRQLLFVMLAVEGGKPNDLSRDDLSLQVDGETRKAVHGVEGQDGSVYYPRPDGCVCEHGYDTYATFPLSAPLSTDALAVRRVGGEESREWTLPADAREELEAPTTEWTLHSFEAPETVGPDESFSVAYEAENAGDAAGLFRGVLNQAGPMYGVTARWKTEVPAGETVRREGTISTLSEIDADVDEVRLRLRTVAGHADHEVRVE